MLRNYFQICKCIRTDKVWRACLSTESKEKWDLVTSVCVERKPVATPLLNDLEMEFQKYLTQVEYERSLKSDHEMRHINDLKRAELLKNVDKLDMKKIDVDGSAVQTAQDFEDACVEELAKFKLASRETDADKTGDTKSLSRKLDKHLVLLTQQKIGANNYYLLPQGIRQDGETLKQTAERVLNESCDNQIKVQFFGNAPIGFYKYKYPKDVQKNGSVGAKVFIYFARYLNGQITNENDYKWLDRLELSNEMPNEYYKSLAKCLIDEN